MIQNDNSYIMVEAKRNADAAWETFKTRTLNLLNDFKPCNEAEKYSQYGGWLDKKVEATGFFYVKKIEGRWWLIDPEGYLYINKGVVAVTPGESPSFKRSFDEKFGNEEKWAEFTHKLLKDNGFNGTGAWSSDEVLKKGSHRIPYTKLSYFLTSYGDKKGLTHQQSGHKGFTNDVMPVFDPEFEGFCDEYAKSLAETSEDPYLIGHFSDNELPTYPELLEKYLTSDPNDPDMIYSYQAAWDWFKSRKGENADTKDITSEDQDAFREYIYDRYFEVTTKAIRKYDPNHLCLGSRYWFHAKKSPGMFGAAGKHLDVIAINYYNVWGPDLENMKEWYSWSDKPVLITEWYTKGEDSGFPNTSGAGWIVRTQRDRGNFYQHYILGLLEAKTCVGWHWFKLLDNDPEDLKTDPSNRDSNKGILNNRYEPYMPLLEMMREINYNVYRLIDYIDKNAKE